MSSITGTIGLVMVATPIDTGRRQIPLYIQVTDTLNPPVFGSIPLVIINSGAQSNIPLVISGLGGTPGGLTASRNIPLFINRASYSEFIPLFLQVIYDNPSSGIPMSISGVASVSNNIPLTLSDIVGTASNNMPLYISGY